MEIEDNKGIGSQILTKATPGDNFVNVNFETQSGAKYYLSEADPDSPLFVHMTREYDGQETKYTAQLSSDTRIEIGQRVMYMVYRDPDLPDWFVSSPISRIEATDTD